MLIIEICHTWTVYPQRNWSERIEQLLCLLEFNSFFSGMEWSLGHVIGYHHHHEYPYYISTANDFNIFSPCTVVTGPENQKKWGKYFCENLKSCTGMRKFNNIS
jgi:hypothetical protein